VNGDNSEKKGQIAHLDRNPGNPRLENLVWLCFDHHDDYDSTTRQSKNYMIEEVRQYRDKLIQDNNRSDVSIEDVQDLRKFLKRYSDLFTYLFATSGDLAFAITVPAFDELTNIRDYWETSTERSFNLVVRDIQDLIHANVVGLCQVYDHQHYDIVGNYLRFDSQAEPKGLLDGKKERAAEFVNAIAGYYGQLQQIAVR
jgi:hypothetical protein